MPTIEETRALLIEKLQELFQLDQPDLDFGFYRIMHLRSREISEFLENGLLSKVQEALTEYTPVEKQQVQKQLTEAIKQAEALGVDPESVPKVKELREKLTESIDLQQVECDVYDALYHFFSRYYSDGDFISQRVYKEGVYAIPYEGEEVKLHWANADQYYVKTCEYLRDYCFRTTSNRRVHFKLIDAAEGEHGNIKAAEGKNRVFILAKDNFCSEENGELILRLEYRPATMNDWPKDERGDQSSPPSQEALLTFADTQILALSEIETWTAELSVPYIKSDGEEAGYSTLFHHLKRYAARNTFDYFIHKDLGTFLRRELDFFIKNEIMYLDDIEKETAPRVEQYLSKLRAVRRIAKKIIEFLAQLENFQKKLWLKKKFVVETNYCITLDRVSEEFYEEIAASDAQREEWVKLFAIDEIEAGTGDLLSSGIPGYSNPLTTEFLTANPNLVLDTKFFSEDFKQQLLDSIPNFDELCDGLLLHSENFQALNLLQERYREQVNKIFIDPPYNTGNDDAFVYKDNYQDSTWLSMIFDRINMSKILMQEASLLSLTLDDREQAKIIFLLNSIFGADNFLANVIWWKRHGRNNNAKIFSDVKDFLIIYRKDNSVQCLKVEKDEGNNNGYSNPDNDPRGDWTSISYVNPAVKSERPNLVYPIHNPITGEEIVHDTNAWKYAKSENERHIRENRLYWGPKGENRYPRLKVFLSETPTMVPMDVWVQEYAGTTDGATRAINNLGITGFNSFPKPDKLVERVVKILPNGLPNNADTVLDYFAGSGTTGHAVINLNREDGGHRKYILVEMGDYFETVLKPRIEKVVYANNWKDGKPTDRTTGVSQCVKYIRLESYEDTLNNLAFKTNDHFQQELKYNEDSDLREEYILKYFLEMESKESPSPLNAEAFFEPTEYQLKIKKPGSDESVYQKVDLLETFNYLIGLKVKNIGKPERFSAKFKRDQDGKLILDGKLKRDKSGLWWFRTVTGETLDGQKVLIIWRNRPGKDVVKEDSFEMSPKNATETGMEQDNIVLDAWFEMLGFDSESNEYDIIYVNGTNNLENLNSSNAKWKVRLIEEEFYTKMWN